MPQPKYAHIYVSRQVNVSSSGHYHLEVSWDGGGRDYSIGDGFLTDEGTWAGAPQYLEQEVKRQIAEMFRDGSAKFFEYDLQGNKRWENLRYHNPAQVARWAETLCDPTLSFHDLPIELRLLLKLVATPDYAISRNRAPYSLRYWAYLIHNNHDRTWNIQEGITPAKFDKLKPFLRCIKSGTNARDEDYDYWVAENAPDTHNAISWLKESE